jgi:hypothetical protein
MLAEATVAEHPEEEGAGHVGRRRYGQYLPFTNLSGDPEQDYFVDGVTESLTTDLSRISGSLVIARNTAFAYKGKPFDVRQIGRELHVRYVLEGSVQRGGQSDARERPTHRRGDRQSPLGRSVRQALSRPLRHAGRNRRAPCRGELCT